MGKYEQIIEWIFNKHYQAGKIRLIFNREELVEASKALGIARIKNLGDIPYSFRFRRDLPKSIQSTAPSGTEWIIVGAGLGTYEFRLASPGKIQTKPLYLSYKNPRCNSRNRASLRFRPG